MADEATEIVASATRQLAKYESELATLRAALEQATKTNETYRRELGSVASRTVALTNEKVDLRAALDQTKFELQVTLSAQRDTEAQRFEAAKRAEKAEAERDEYRHNARHLAESLDRIVPERDEARAESDRLRAENETMRAALIEYADARDEYGSVRWRCPDPSRLMETDDRKNDAVNDLYEIGKRLRESGRKEQP